MTELNDFQKRWAHFYREDGGVHDVAQTLRVYAIDGNKDQVKLGMPLHKAITQPAGMFSAPALFGQADLCGTWLAMQQVPEGVFPLAVSVAGNVVSNTKEGDAIATATIVRAGRTIIVADVETHSEVTGAILSKFTFTYSVPRPKQ